MDIKFEPLESFMPMGRWRTMVSTEDGSRKFYHDEGFRKILGAGDDIAEGIELFNYWHDGIDEEYRDEIDSFFVGWKNNVQPFEYVYVWNTPSGEHLTLRNIGRRIVSNDKYAVFEGIMQDVTDLFYINAEFPNTDLLPERIIFELHKQIGDLTETMGTIVEFRNMESATHVKCVRIFTEIIANYMAEHYPEYGLIERDVKMISDAAPIHDIGKIAIPDMILLKPGRLTREEFNMMKTHSQRGYEIIQSLKTFQGGVFKKFCADVAHYHHERYDGRGYPAGLTGDEIPIAAQIVSLVDVYDALITPRVYKSAYTTEQAYGMIMRGECGAFNPKLLKAFEEMHPLMEKVAKRYKDNEGDKLDPHKI